MKQFAFGAISMLVGIALGYGYYWHVQAAKICLHETSQPWLSCMSQLL